MSKVNGKELEELYEDTAGEFETNLDRFEHIAALINDRCEKTMLNEVICSCEQQLKKMREQGL